jgi:O-antigen/teichoic acid export membrane protein
VAADLFSERTGPQDESVGAPPEIVDSPEAGARFIRGGVVRLIAWGAGLLLSLGSVPLVTRHLGPARYGLFGTVSAMIFIIAGFTEAGLTTLAIRDFTNASRQERAVLLRNLVGLRVTATLVAVLAVAGVTALTGSPHEIPLGVLLAGGGLSITITGENYMIPLLTELRIPAHSLLDLLRLAVLAAAYVGLVLIGAGLLPFLGATLLSGAVLTAATIAVVGRGVAGVPAFDLALWGRILRRTLPYAVAAAVGIVYFREALIITEYVATRVQAGYYAAAFRIVEVLTTLPYLIVTASFPIFARAARDDLARLRYGLQRLFEVALLAGVWMSLCVVAAARLGIEVIAGHRFAPAVPVLEIQGAALVTSFLAATFGYSLLSLGMNRALLWSNLTAVTVATAVSLALIPPLGARGAAIAPVGAEATLVVAYAIALSRRDRGLRVSLRVVPKLAVAAAAATGAAFAASSSGLVRLVILTAVYGAAALALRIVPAELWNALLRRVPG